MRLTPIRHEDSRRLLTEYISDMHFRRAKVIEVKEKSVLGNHYHNNNDSVFYILKGKAQYVIKEPKERAKISRGWIFEGEGLFVPRGLVHTFTVYNNSILLETCSEPYDPTDEIQFPE